VAITVVLPCADSHCAQMLECAHTRSYLVARPLARTISLARTPLHSLALARPPVGSRSPVCWLALSHSPELLYTHSPLLVHLLDHARMFVGSHPLTLTRTCSHSPARCLALCRTLYNSLILACRRSSTCWLAYARLPVGLHFLELANT